MSRSLTVLDAPTTATVATTPVAIPATTSVRNSRVRRVPQASVCIPAHNEEQTIGEIVARLNATVVASGHVSEIIVIDDRSTDFTRVAAELAGAKVYASGDILPTFGPSKGKGDAMWRSLVVSSGDIVLWCDADLHSFDVANLASIIETLRDNPEAVMVKGSFRRLDDNGEVRGGRVTELSARPMLALLAPEAALLDEPLGGIFAVRRSAAERLAFESDYGVDVGLLLDIMHTYGSETVLQVTLGDLCHNHQTNEALAVQACAVQRAILCRSGFERCDLGAELHRAGLRTASIAAPLRPPLRSLTWYENERARLIPTASQPELRVGATRASRAVSAARRRLFSGSRTEVAVQRSLEPPAQDCWALHQQ